VVNRIHWLLAIAAAMAAAYPTIGSTSVHTVQIATVTPGAERTVSVGSWYELSDGSGWVFRPDTDIDHVELAFYGLAEAWAVGATPFVHHQLRSSGLWPDGPENDLGQLGYEVSPNVLGDNNQYLYGKPDYWSLRLFGGHLSPDSVYQVSFADSPPARVWLHPMRSNSMTMSAAILQSSETTLTTPVFGPASVTRTIVSASLTRFDYAGLLPDQATGLKDDYPVGSYGQRPGSHGNGDFGWFPGYSLWFHNEGPDAVVVALFVTTGFTGPSGAPTNTLANDTFWQSDEVLIAAGDSATVGLHFDDVRGYALSDNPFPHTAGGQSAPDGTAGAAVNVFDRLQVSAIGWEVRSGSGGSADAGLVIAPRTTTIVTSVPGRTRPPTRVRGLTNVAPNPFGHATRVEYEVPETAHVAIRVYDVRGRLVTTLVDGEVAAGGHVAAWTARDKKGEPVVSGIYFIRMVCGAQETVRKAIVLR